MIFGVRSLGVFCSFLLALLLENIFTAGEEEGLERISSVASGEWWVRRDGIGSLGCSSRALAPSAVCLPLCLGRDTPVSERRACTCRWVL